MRGERRSSRFLAVVGKTSPFERARNCVGIRPAPWELIGLESEVFAHPAARRALGAFLLLVSRKSRGLYTERDEGVRYLKIMVFFEER